MEPYLQMLGICKRFEEGNVLANDRVDFSVQPGEIHALIGENGAGKTTLMNILCGLLPADRGRILLKGEEVRIDSPLTATRLGIGMMHQHFRLIPDFTVAQNIVLGREPRRGKLLLDGERAEREVEQTALEYGLAVDPRARVSTLSTGLKQQAEILKILYRQVDLLVLDEPSTVLAEQEIRNFIQILRRLAGMGKTIILITHRLDEVLEVSHAVTVMRQGRVVGAVKTAQTGLEELAGLMMGAEAEVPLPRTEARFGGVVLELQEVSLRQGRQARPLLDRVSLRVRAGQVVGVAALSGNGLADLEDVTAGLKRASSGRILHGGLDITNLSTLHRRERGLSYVPADRLQRGASLEATVSDNILVSLHHNFLKWGVFDRKAVRRFVAGLLEEFGIQGGPDSILGLLSGGNIQKVILARELAARNDFILFSEPTWGLDLASSFFIYRLILKLKQEGVAVLLISSSLEEILALCDLIAVMRRGRLVASFPNGPEVSREEVGGYMLGLREGRLAEN